MPFTSYVTNQPKAAGLTRVRGTRAKRKRTMAKKRNQAQTRYHRGGRTAQLAGELSGKKKRRRKKVAKKKRSSKKKSTKKRRKRASTTTSSKSRRRPKPGTKARAKRCKTARKKKRASSAARSLAKKRGSKKSKSRAGRSLAMTRWCRNFQNLDIPEGELDDE